MMDLVTPTIRQGGVNTVFVMVRKLHDRNKRQFFSQLFLTNNS
jgi:hypothetical protein